MTTDSAQVFNFKEFISFERLEQIFQSLASEVFVFFNQDPQQAIATVQQSESQDYYEDKWRIHKFHNGTIAIEILHESRYYDNSMSAKWIHRISLSIQSLATVAPILRMHRSSDSESTWDLYYEENPEYQTFVDYYLDQLRSAIQAKPA